MPPSLQQVLQSLSLFCSHFILTLLPIYFSHSFNFSGVGKGHNNLKTFAALTAGWTASLQHRAEAGQNELLTILWKSLQWLHLFLWHLWLGVIWSGLQLQRSRRQHYLDLSFLGRRTALYPLCRKGSGRQQDSVSFPFLLCFTDPFLWLLPCLSCRNKDRTELLCFPVTSVKGTSACSSPLPGNVGVSRKQGASQVSA